ncbi:MAG: hypothetical protein ACRENE_10930 [Polyangiaceae bacterium]
MLSAESIGAARFTNAVCVVSLAAQAPPDPELLVGLPEDEVSNPLDDVVPDDPVPLEDVIPLEDVSPELVPGLPPEVYPELVPLLDGLPEPLPDEVPSPEGMTVDVGDAQWIRTHPAPSIKVAGRELNFMLSHTEQYLAPSATR